MVSRYGRDIGANMHNWECFVSTTVVQTDLVTSVWHTSGAMLSGCDPNSAFPHVIQEQDNLSPGPQPLIYFSLEATLHA
jgi:hypothetical protein